LNWEPTFFTANITFFGKKDGFNLFISKLADEKRKLDANAIKWLLKPIVKLLEYLPLRLVRKIVEQLRHVVFSRLLEMSDEGAFMRLFSIAATINLFCSFFPHNFLPCPHGRSQGRQPEGVGRHQRQHGIPAAVSHVLPFARS
jgi:hypothetical protein